MSEFIIINIPSGERGAADVRGTFQLRRNDTWNDFTTKSRFDLTHVGDDGKRTRVGKVKILRRTTRGTSSSVERVTEVPGRFDHLEQNEFISLGQQQSYYETLRELLGRDIAMQFLRAICDISAVPALAIPFETSARFRNSMLRENEARLARRFGAAWVRGEEVHQEPSFRYSTLIGAGETTTDVRFDFDEDDPLPGRIVGIIGRNAVGKTGFMAGLAIDLANLGYSTVLRERDEESRFPGGRPLFTRVIAVSYSAFDKFKRPAPDPGSTYVYCGIRGERGAISSRSLYQAYAQNKARIRRLELVDDWIGYIRDILGDERPSNDMLLAEISEDDSGEERVESIFDGLSSGQAILCHFVTALLAWIQQQSLVLFDEPETHLHPNAVASLFVVLSRILKANDSYAVIATHSPIVLQEIPAKRVLLFIRRGATTSSAPLGMESFGESITELTRHVFKTIEVDSPYKETLSRLSKGAKSPEEVLERFPEGLGVAAQAYVLAQFDRNGRPK